MRELIAFMANIFESFQIVIPLKNAATALEAVLLHVVYVIGYAMLGMIYLIAQTLKIPKCFNQIRIQLCISCHFSS